MPEARLVLAALTCYRLSQLVALDDGPLFVFDAMREAAKKRAATGSFMWRNLAEFVTCPFCLGVWFAIPCTALVLLPTTIGDIILFWLGIAGAQAFFEDLRNGSK